MFTCGPALMSSGVIVPIIDIPIILDNFTGTGDITNHVGDLNATWTSDNNNGNNATDLVLSGGYLSKGINTGKSAVIDSATNITTDSFYIEADINYTLISAGEMWLYARYDPVINNYYAADFVLSGDGNLFVGLYLLDPFIDLGSTTIPFPDGNHTFRLTITDALKEIKVDGVVVVTSNDNTYQGGNNVAFALFDQDGSENIKINSIKVNSLADYPLGVDGYDLSMLRYDSSTTLDTVPTITWTDTGPAYNIDNTNYLFGGGSLTTAQTDFTDVLKTPDTFFQFLSPGPSSFCLEFWLQFTTGSPPLGNDMSAMVFWDNTNTDVAVFLIPGVDLSGAIYLSAVSQQNGTPVDNTGNVTAQGSVDLNWHHVAYTFDGSTYRLFWDGTSIYSNATASKPFVSTAGHVEISCVTYNRIDNARFSVGTARYTGNFTPPGENF